MNEMQYKHFVNFHNYWDFDFRHSVRINIVAIDVNTDFVVVVVIGQGGLVFAFPNFVIVAENILKIKKS